MNYCEEKIDLIFQYIKMLELMRRNKAEREWCAIKDDFYHRIGYFTEEYHDNKPDGMCGGYFKDRHLDMNEFGEIKMEQLHNDYKHYEELLEDIEFRLKENSNKIYGELNQIKSTL